MAKPEWGIKRICPNCGARYYDLRKDPPTCPSCGVIYDPEALLKSRRARSAPVDDTKKPVIVADEDTDLETEDGAEIEDAEEEAAVGDLEDEAEEDAEDEDDVLIEDASELGEDDDVGEVVPVENGEEDDEGR